MRKQIGTAVAGALLAVVLSSCTSGTTTGHGAPQTPTIVLGSGSLGTPNARCAQLAAAARQIAAAQVALYTGDQRAVTTLTSSLGAIRGGAPAAVQSAIDRLVSGFRSASDLLAHPTPAHKQKLTQVAAQLSRDGMTVSSYATSKCGH